MTHRSCCCLFGVCRVRRTCRSCGRALSRARRAPGSRRRTSWSPLYRGYRIGEKRETVKRDRRRLSQDSLPPRADLLSALLAQRRLAETYFVLAALSAGPSLLSVRFTPRPVCIPRVGNYHHNERIVNGCSGKLCYYPPHNGPPHSYHPNFNPSGATAVSVTANFSSRIHARILHTYLKPIAPPRAPYHWLLPQFLAQWYSLARVHLLFRSATAAVAADVVSGGERDRGKGGGWRSGGEVGKVVGGKVPRFCQGGEYYCRASPTGAARDGNELLDFAKR